MSEPANPTASWTDRATRRSRLVALAFGAAIAASSIVACSQPARPVEPRPLSCPGGAHVPCSAGLVCVEDSRRHCEVCYCVSPLLLPVIAEPSDDAPIDVGANHGEAARASGVAD